MTKQTIKGGHGAAYFELSNVVKVTRTILGPGSGVYKMKEGCTHIFVQIFGAGGGGTKEGYGGAAGDYREVFMECPDKIEYIVGKGGIHGGNGGDSIFGAPINSDQLKVGALITNDPLKGKDGAIVIEEYYTENQQG